MFSFFGLDSAPALPRYAGDFFGADLLDYTIAGAPAEAYGCQCDAARAAEGFGADAKPLNPGAGFVPPDPNWHVSEAVKAYMLDLWRRVAAVTHARDADKIAASLRAVTAKGPGPMLSALIEAGPPPESAGAALFYTYAGAAVAKARAAKVAGLHFAPGAKTIAAHAIAAGAPKHTAIAKGKQGAAAVAVAVKPEAAKSAKRDAATWSEAAAKVATAYIDAAKSTAQAAIQAPRDVLADANRSIDHAIDAAAHAVEVDEGVFSKAVSDLSSSAGSLGFGVGSGTALAVAGVGVVVGGVFFAPEIAAAWKAKAAARRGK